MSLLKLNFCCFLFVLKEPKPSKTNLAILILFQYFEIGQLKIAHKNIKFESTCKSTVK